VQTNLVGTLHCLEKARRHKARIILLSTSRVYPLAALNRIAGEFGARLVLHDFIDGITALDPAALTVLAGAIANHEGVRFVYRAGDGAQSRRHVEPQRLVANGRRWYLVAWDLARDDWRIFRVDRLAGVTATGGRAAPRALPAADAAEFVASKLRNLWPTAPAVVDVDAPADVLRARLGQAPGEVDSLPGGTSRWRVDADRIDWMAIRLLMLDLPFRVQSPPALIDRLRTFGDRARRATTPGTPESPGPGDEGVFGGS
jgi:predicted DNA-binding transcriptional regulator YafY